MVRYHCHSVFPTDDAKFIRLRGTTFKLCEFLVDCLGVRKIGSHFSHRGRVHASCHGLRGLLVAQCSE